MNLKILFLYSFCCELLLTLRYLSSTLKMGIFWPFVALVVLIPGSLKEFVPLEGVI